MKVADLNIALKGMTGEVYVYVGNQHARIVGVMESRYNDDGPLVVELVINENRMPDVMYLDRTPAEEV